ncbi:hypothetical protein [Rhodococcus sp. NPDC058639]|uniref:hypothetical protein n=1 Tax=Rhodococcus sp. NPDC058639 TaxID=3346570 RepID=UPI00365B3A93
MGLAVSRPPIPRRAAAGLRGRGSRGAEILIEPGNGVVATASAATTGLVMISDEQIESLGGLAYSMSASTAGTSFSATKVELPQVSVSITVGGNGAQPTPSGPADVETPPGTVDDDPVRLPQGCRRRSPEC